MLLDRLIAYVYLVTANRYQFNSDPETALDPVPRLRNTQITKNTKLRVLKLERSFLGHLQLTSYGFMTYDF